MALQPLTFISKFRSYSVAVSEGGTPARDESAKSLIFKGNLVGTRRLELLTSTVSR